MGLVRVAVAALAGAALVRDTEGFAGFGSRPKPAKGKPKKGKGGLAPDAAKILDKANGNLDAAQGMLFQQQAMKLKDKDPALFRAMETHAAGTPMPDAMHEKLVELTWDTVAAYLPVTASRAPADDVKEKLRAIAVACGEGAVLDVGCGDGAIIPFLKERGLEADDYVGVDVSGRMIDVARATHKKFKFVQGNFMTDDSSGDEPKYDCVLFNGSLQFATDVAAMLRRAKGCLREGGRIVIAHANGAAFVRDEQRGNPNVVQSLMPGEEELAALGEEVGLSVADIDNNLDLDSDEFYLEVLEQVALGEIRRVQ